MRKKRICLATAFFIGTLSVHFTWHLARAIPFLSSYGSPHQIVDFFPPAYYLVGLVHALLITASWDILLHLVKRERWKLVLGGVVGCLLEWARAETIHSFEIFKEYPFAIPLSFPYRFDGVWTFFFYFSFMGGMVFALRFGDRWWKFFLCLTAPFVLANLGDQWMDLFILDYPFGYLDAFAAMLDGILFSALIYAAWTLGNLSPQRTSVR